MKNKIIEISIVVLTIFVVLAFIYLQLMDFQNCVQSYESEGLSFYEACLRCKISLD